MILLVFLARYESRGAAADYADADFDHVEDGNVKSMKMTFMNGYC